MCLLINCVFIDEFLKWICLYLSREPQDIDHVIDELCVYRWLVYCVILMNCVFIWMNLFISKQRNTGYRSWYWWIVCLLMNCVLCYIDELCVYTMNCVFIWMNLSISKQGTTWYRSWYWWIVYLLRNFWNESVYI